ncbi:MAG: helix-turn-helix domain-containing protein [Microcystaceae cyanobacterium]
MEKAHSYRFYPTPEQDNIHPPITFLLLYHF